MDQLAGGQPHLLGEPAVQPLQGVVGEGLQRGQPGDQGVKERQGLGLEILPGRLRIVFAGIAEKIDRPFGDLARPSCCAP